MKQFMYFLTAFFMLTLLASLLPEPAQPKSGPRTITLSAHNTASLNMPITGPTAAALQQDLMRLSSRLSPNEPIYLVLNSPGGNIPDGEKIIETANGLPNPIHTISIFSASMSFIISQYLDRRLILESGTMMSHRAYAEGLGGQVPGNLITRAFGLLESLTEIDAHIAKRAGISTETYQAFIRDEVWLRGQQAVSYKFADEVVRVQCDQSLRGVGPTQTIKVFVFDVNVAWYKCPLITQPALVDTSGLDANQAKEIQMLFFDKPGYIRQYGVNKLLGGL